MNGAVEAGPVLGEAARLEKDGAVPAGPRPGEQLGRGRKFGPSRREISAFGADNFPEI